MKRKNIGIEITPHGTIERHNLDIESTVMWGTKNKNLGRPAWLTPNSLRKGKRFSFTLLRSTTIDPLSLPGEVSIIDKGVKTRQGMTEQYHKVTSVTTAQDSMVVLIGLLTVLVIASIVFLGVSAPFIYREWREQNAESETNKQASSFVLRDSDVSGASGNSRSGERTSENGRNFGVHYTEEIVFIQLQGTYTAIEGDFYQRSKATIG